MKCRDIFNLQKSLVFFPFVITRAIQVNLFSEQNCCHYQYSHEPICPSKHVPGIVQAEGDCSNLNQCHITYNFVTLLREI